MFKQTVGFSQLREKMAHFFEMTQEDSVIQIVHRGDSIKVMMTQEHYFHLLSRLAVYERGLSAQSVPSESPESIAERIKAKARPILEQEESQENGYARLGSANKIRSR